MKELLIATTNSGKILEYRAIIKELTLKVKAVSLKDIKIAQKIEETGQTFEENAVQKARFYHDLSGLATLADDAGLEIDYLSGEPGVKTRRWPGYEASDEKLIQIALNKLQGVPPEKRTAQLKAVICLIFPGDKKNYTFEGILRGIEQKIYWRESEKFATKFQNRISDKIPFKSRGINSANFYVLRKAKMPSILLELGFISNAADEAKLKQPEFREKIVEVISRGLV